MMRKFKILVCALFALTAMSAACSASAAEMGTVTAESGLRLRADASTSAKTIEIVEYGAELVVTEVGSSWCKVNYAGTAGYMSAEYLNHTADGDYTKPLNGVITGSIVNLRSKPNTSSEVLGQLAKGSNVSVIGLAGGWYHIKSGKTEGYVHPDYLTANTAYLPSLASGGAASSTASSENEASQSEEAAAVTAELTELRSQVIEYAKQYIGTKYTYGGKSPSTGFDCSGFVYYVFKNFGYTLNPGASAQMKVVTNIKRGELVPGDLVFFNNGSGVLASHVGIYVGDNNFIHAVSPGNPVTISSLDQSYYSRYWVAGGRVLPLE